MTRFIFIYVMCVGQLHDYGERAWPWNVRFVWSHNAKAYDDFKAGNP
jgi:hypothetical protein